MIKTGNGTVIQLEDLRKSFGTQMVLDGIDLQISKGETVAILGRSGTGKSVLLKLMIGLIPPDSGSVRMEGQEIGHISRKELNDLRKRIGFLFQQGALYDSLTVEENVAFPLRRHTKRSDEEIGKRVNELLSDVGMADSAKKMPAEISGGMQKRVGLARALALEPEILLLDEPTSALDPITAGEIVDLIERLRKDHHTTSVIVTHDIRTIPSLSAHVVMLDRGKIAMEGTFEEFTKSDSPFVSQFLKQSLAGGAYV